MNSPRVPITHPNEGLQACHCTSCLEVLSDTWRRRDSAAVWRFEPSDDCLSAAACVVTNPVQLLESWREDSRDGIDCQPALCWTFQLKAEQQI